jgi:hypothetical protein
MKISQIAEASTTLPMFRDLPGGTALIKTLHDQYQLDPKQTWGRIQKLSWADIKGETNRYRRTQENGNWVIMSFDQGSVAIMHSGGGNSGSYTVVTATPDGQIQDNNFQNSRPVLSFIRQNLGMKKISQGKAQIFMGSVAASGKRPAQGYYNRDIETSTGSYTKWDRQVRNKMATGQSLSTIPASGAKDVKMKGVTGKELHDYRAREREKLKQSQRASTDTILTRFTPLLARAARTALADINGITQVMAKSGAYERLKHKIEKNIEPLQDAIDKLETTGGLETDRYHYRNPGKEYVRRAIKRAIALSAVYYYPNETGDVRSNGDPDNQEGMNRMLGEIDQGDLTKLKTVLEFFKQELMRAA